ncbi:MAG TPA: ATP-binding protein, partial [Armatimonadota bacterium]|nr:ATP-binding protein [Armatimonadota bacterium]
VQTVLNNLRDSIMLSPRQVAIEASVDDLRGTSREASAIALITTELVTNALTHGNATTIGVRFTVTDQDACLSVTDDGEGEVRPDEVLRSRKLGLQLVALLAEEQLGGSFEITRTDAQTSATVRFTLEPAQADAPTPDAS